VAHTRRHDGGDGGWIRRCSINTSQIGLAYDEDQFRDTERLHTTEAASVLVFSEAFCIPNCDAATLDHFVITTDNIGIFCVDETITITAVDTDGNSPFTTYDQQITLDTGTTFGDWIYDSGGTPGNFTAGPGDGTATYLFDSSDGGDVTFRLDYTSGTVSSVNYRSL